MTASTTPTSGLGPGVGHLRRGEAVAEVRGSMDELGQGRTYLALLPDGPMVVLDGPGSVIWQAAQNCPIDQVTARVAERLDLVPEDIAEAISAFVDGLVDQGLLTRVTGNGTP